MDDIGVLDKQNVITFGGESYPVDFTLASIYYLTQKYGDVAALFSNLRGGGIDAKSIEVICDLVYAGMLKYSDDDKIESPVSFRQIMNRMHFSDIGPVTSAITGAFSQAFPDAPKNPTKAAKAAKVKDGTGDSSIPRAESD